MMRVNQNQQNRNIEWKHRVTIAEDLKEKCLCIGYADVEGGKIYAVFNEINFYNSYIGMHV